MADLQNELKWSFSRNREFESCLRKYYYNRYLKWGGWLDGCEQDRADAYRLSQMTSAAALAGQVVHNAIMLVLKNYRDSGILMSVEGAIKRAMREWDKSVDDSLSGRWRDNPKKHCCLIEDYYEDPDRDAQVAQRQNSIEVCLRNFYETTTLTQLMKSRPANWLALDDEPFLTADISGMPMFGRPDLAYSIPATESSPASCRIFDWKTSKAKSEHETQVRYYALFAARAWRFPDGDVKARLVYLYPDLREQAITVTAEELRRSEAGLTDSFIAMHILLNYLSNNRATDLSVFPVTRRSGLCRYCNFREICTERTMPADTGEPPSED